MLKLIFLLIGPHAFRPQWPVLGAAGLLLILLGAVVASGQIPLLTHLVYGLLGVGALVVGAGHLLGTLTATTAGSWRLEAIKAAGALVAGGLILTPLHNSGLILGLVFGLALLIDGGNRAAASYVFQVPGWRWLGLYAAIELILAVMLLAGWPLAREANTALGIGLLIGLSGLFLLRLGLMLRNLEEEAAILLLPIFARRGWYDSAPILVGDALAEEAAPTQPMVVHFWTPVGAADGISARRPLIDRYVAAIDRHGEFSTGHSAIELAPDLYLSHVPAEEFSQQTASFPRSLLTGVENDIAGLFQPSYAVEISDWQPADVQVLIHNYSPRRLRAFWFGYRQDSTYNLANRNCSILVTAAIDAAIEGRLATSRPWRRLVRLLFDPDLWIAALVRSRATTMSWTPGFALEYTRAMARIVDRPDLAWAQRFTLFLRFLRRQDQPAETQPMDQPAR